MPLLEQYKGTADPVRPPARWCCKPASTLGVQRATYQREAERGARTQPDRHQRIGIIHVDDSFGADLVRGAAKGFAAWLNPVFVPRSTTRARGDFSKIAPLVN